MELNDMQHFSMNSQICKIHYMELVNKNSNSDDTMALVAEELLEKFGNTQDGWMMLVGDVKA